MKKITTFIIIVCIHSGVIAQPNADFKKADSLFNSQNYSLAKAEYESILKRHPGTAVAWNRFGFSCYILNQYDEAIKHFTISLSMNPSEQVKSIAFIRLAKSFGAKKDKANAFFYLKQAVDAGFMNLNEINTDKDLQLLNNEPELKKINEAIYTKINPCMFNPKSREFDFWVGVWDVFDTKTGRPAGTNTITITSGGCILLESWVNTIGGTGTSINYVNTETGKWEQIYKDNDLGMPVHYTDGEYLNGVMKFAVTTKGTDGKVQTGRFVFEKKSNGDVRQYQEITGDDGKTWIMEFDLIYRRRK